MVDWKKSGRIAEIITSFNNAYNEVYSDYAAENPEYQTEMMNKMDYFSELLDYKYPVILVYNRVIDGNRVSIAIDTQKKSKRVEIRISVNPVNCNSWDYDNVTGTIGIKGLAEIYKQLLTIIVYVKNTWGYEIICSPTDIKRAKAYRYLERLGFVWHNDEYRLK